MQLTNSALKHILGFGNRMKILNNVFVIFIEDSWVNVYAYKNTIFLFQSSSLELNMNKVIVCVSG